MLLAERVISLALMGLSAYFMWHALVLPIGWVPGEGPGGGAFPFWLSAVMLAASGMILVRSFISQIDLKGPFFDRDMLRSVAFVTASLVVTIALIPVIGAYVALMLFLIWYLRFYGGHGWTLTGILTVATPVFLFFFFEVTLKILLPKGMTEPFFLPLYARFF